MSHRHPPSETPKQDPLAPLAHEPAGDREPSLAANARAALMERRRRDLDAVERRWARLFATPEEGEKNKEDASAEGPEKTGAPDDEGPIGFSWAGGDQAGKDERRLAEELALWAREDETAWEEGAADWARRFAEGRLQRAWPMARAAIETAMAREGERREAVWAWMAEAPAWAWADEERAKKDASVSFAIARLAAKTSVERAVERARAKVAAAGMLALATPSEAAKEAFARIAWADEEGWEAERGNPPEDEADEAGRRERLGNEMGADMLRAGLCPPIQAEWMSLPPSDWLLGLAGAGAGGEAVATELSRRAREIEKARPDEALNLKEKAAMALWQGMSESALAAWAQAEPAFAEPPWEEIKARWHSFGDQMGAAAARGGEWGRAIVGPRIGMRVKPKAGELAQEVADWADAVFQNPEAATEALAAAWSDIEGRSLRAALPKAEPARDSAASDAATARRRL
jgi:hypothetical protein